MSTPEIHPETDPTVTPPGLLARGDLVGDAYRVERQIGSGGMGTVFSAVDERSGTRVAVKWVLPGADHARSRDRLVREWHLARQVRHPNVVEIFDAGEERGSSYLVMELLEGESLEAWVQRGPFEPDIAIRVLMPVMRGVAAAHAAGIVHRDLKPQNVILSSDAKGVRPKIIDFGISRAAAAGVYGDRQLTQHGFMVGTPLYMAPEQLIGTQEADRASDVYALGVILFEMLAGTPPFEASGSDPDLITEKLDRPAARLKDLLPDLDPRISAVVAKALERSPTKRFGTVESFGRALEPFASARFGVDDPIYQGPAPLEARGSTLRVRRRAASSSAKRWIIGGAFASALLLVGVLVGVLLGARPTQTPVRATRLPAMPPPAEDTEPDPVEPERETPTAAVEPVALAVPVPESVDPPEATPVTRRRRRRRLPRRISRRGRSSPQGRGRSGRLSVDDF